MKSEKTMNQIISRIAEKQKALRRSPNIDFSSTYAQLNSIEQLTQAVDDYILALAVLASIRIKE